MNINNAKTWLGVSSLLGLLVSASAGPLPSGSAPSLAPTPAGLNTHGPTYGTPAGYGTPVSVGEELFASGGAVYVTDLGPTGAGYDENLFVASPTDGANGLFMNDHSTPNGTTFYLGTFAAGTEIEFGLDVTTTGNIWYDGAGSRNADGVVHAYMVNDYEGLANTTYVGFEDEVYPGGDFNYLDQIYAFTGTEAAITAPTVPDATGTLPLLGLGLGGLAAFGRRFRK